MHNKVLLVEESGAYLAHLIFALSMSMLKPFT